MTALTVQLAPGLTLPTPVLAAAGTFGYGDEISDLADCGQLGALITPTLTLRARPGNPPPRTAEATAGLLHATGLPNPGLEDFLITHLPGLRELSCPVIANIAGDTPEEWTRLAERLTQAGTIIALELNLALRSAREREHPDHGPEGEATRLEAIAAAVGAARAATALPLIAKLPSADIEIGETARAAAAAGADVISVGQAFPAIGIRLKDQTFSFPGVVGGLSGPCIKPIALYQVWRAAQAVSVPILGSGGIMTAEDALEFLIAGASAVAVGTASLISPTAIGRITVGIADYLALHHIHSVKSLIGAARS